MDNRVTDSLRSALEEHQRGSTTSKPETRSLKAGPKTASPILHNTGLFAEILGQRVRGATLPDLFARCVDLVHEFDPPAIEKLADKKTHARRYVARRSQDVHFRSPHLETVETKSGRWISANVSEPQVTTAIKHLAEAANLTRNSPDRRGDGGGLMGMASALLKGDDDQYRGRDDDRYDERYDKRRRKKSIFSEFFD
jgi:hypothetical protein